MKIHRITHMLPASVCLLSPTFSSVREEHDTFLCKNESKRHKKYPHDETDPPHLCFLMGYICMLFCFVRVAHLDSSASISFVRAYLYIQITGPYDFCTWC